MERIVWFLLLMWNFEPPYFKELEWLNQFYIMGRFVTVYVLFLIFLMKGKKYRPGKFVIYFGLMEAVLIFSTFWNGGYSLTSFLMNEVTGISFIVLLAMDGHLLHKPVFKIRRRAFNRYILNKRNTAAGERKLL